MSKLAERAAKWQPVDTYGRAKALPKYVLREVRRRHKHRAKEIADAIREAGNLQGGSPTDLKRLFADAQKILDVNDQRKTQAPTR